MITLIKSIRSKAKIHTDNPNALHNITKELIRRQNGKCPITKRDLRAMTSTNVVVDHDHKSGVIRAALPRAINGLEGKLVALCIRWGQCKTKGEVIQMLRGMADYLELHRVPQTEWLHPDHLSPAEARAKKNKKARARYAKSKEK
ncbi:endonuclease VII [Vibrio phage D529]